MNDRSRTARARSIIRGWLYMVRRLLSHYTRRIELRLGYYDRAYRRNIGHYPDYNNPRTLTEKLAWMRLYDRNPLYTQLADKIAVRDYVRERVGEDVLIPLYGTWEKAKDIGFNSLPESFVLKCNHESGFVIICHDKDKLDQTYACARLATRLKMNHYYRWHEWPYLHIKPRILAEKLLIGHDGGEPLDYKFYCFGGEPGYIVGIAGRHSQLARGNYTPDWEPLPFTGTKDPLSPVARPAQLERMVEIATKLAEGLPYCRVDLYAVEDKVYFGEMTLIPAAGLLKYNPSSYDRYWGDRLKLPTADA